MFFMLVQCSRVEQFQLAQAIQVNGADDRLFTNGRNKRARPPHQRHRPPARVGRIPSACAMDSSAWLAA